MRTVSPHPTQRSPGVLPVTVAALGVVLLGYGALVFGAAPVGGAWLAASGLCLLLSGVFATEWAGEQFELTPRQQITTALALGVGGGLLLVLFVLVNFATFSGGSG